MPLTNAKKADVLDSIYGSENPANLYVGLSTTTPSDDGGNFTEPSGAAGYARLEVANNTTTWENATSADPSVKANKIEFEFNEATDSWGEITYWGIFESSEATNPIDFAEITIPKTATVGDVLRFKAGELKSKLQNPSA